MRHFKHLAAALTAGSLLAAPLSQTLAAVSTAQQFNVKVSVNPPAGACSVTMSNTQVNITYTPGQATSVPDVTATVTCSGQVTSTPELLLDGTTTATSKFGQALTDADTGLVYSIAVADPTLLQSLVGTLTQVLNGVLGLLGLVNGRPPVDLTLRTTVGNDQTLLTTCDSTGMNPGTGSSLCTGNGAGNTHNLYVLF